MMHFHLLGLTPNSGCFPPDWLFDEPKLMDPEIYKHVSVGPMCRYAEDLMSSMKILSSKSGTKLNFQKQLDFRKLKIYYLKEIKSPMVPSVEKDIAEGLMKAVSYFERVYDTKPREVKIPSLYDSNRCVFNILLETIKDFKDLLTCGKGLPFNEKLDFLKCFIGKSQLCFGTLFTFNFAFFPLWYKKSQIDRYQKMLREWIDDFDAILDEDSVLLMPTLPITAFYHEEMLLKFPSSCYTSIFNVLGLPATHCPMGLSREGLPYGIQVVGCKNNDPLTIACGMEIEKAFGGWRNP
ncbi:fatty-acid amide hydrolase 2-A [Caerostris extrusa]|uniref:Fatty-acid amide hydrolase 2-A n=1 Tax=Caerostris extrusa TaxID=172846 RepID=A0AAV4REJ1_CAEEX|nr:fatty-acid amide hydrolase 2-A [Caerostris extrusa]